LNADVNAFQRKFVSEVRRCDELERKLRYIEAEINKENLHIPEIEDLPNAPNPREITDLEVMAKDVYLSTEIDYPFIFSGY
jgi:V-type H+-transporting ATPase subunit a